MAFSKVKFNSHKNHNPSTDILEGWLSPTGPYITYYINVKGNNIGQEGMEYYTGENYGGQGKSFSRHFTADKIPSKYKKYWEELKKIYETKYKTDVSESTLSLKKMVEQIIRKNVGK